MHIRQHTNWEFPVRAYSPEHRSELIDEFPYDQYSFDTPRMRIHAPPECLNFDGCCRRRVNQSAHDLAVPLCAQQRSAQLRCEFYQIIIQIVGLWLSYRHTHSNIHNLCGQSEKHPKRITRRATMANKIRRPTTNAHCVSVYVC